MYSLDFIGGHLDEADIMEASFGTRYRNGATNTQHSDQLKNIAHLVDDCWSLNKMALLLLNSSL